MAEFGTRFRGESVEHLVERKLRIEGNAALRKAALAAIVAAIGGVVGIPILMATGLAQGLEVPLACTGFAFAYCTLLYVLARREMVYGGVAWAVLVPFGAMPSLFFLASHLLLPGGAGTFLNGPFSVLYIITIAVTGCAFDFRLTSAAGLAAGATYLLCAWLAMPELVRFEHPDALFRQDLVTLPMYGFKAMMLAVAGMTIGALAAVGRRLSLDVLAEEREKQDVSRLFGQYVSEEVKERLLRDDSRFTGERTEVVVLFSDIRGFTTFSETQPPEAVVARLNEYFDAMVDAIATNGGVVDKFVGDAVMAVFDGVLPIEEPAACAVRAAREMLLRLDALNGRWTASGQMPMRNGVGLHLGEVVEGSIGSEHRKDFTVIGDAVNIAARLESLTKETGCDILLTATVYEALPQALREECQALGTFGLKGRSAEVVVYGISAPPRSHTPVPASPRSGEASAG